MTTPPPPPPPPFYNAPPGDPNFPQRTPSNTLGIVGMILGFISILLGCCGYIGLIFGLGGGVVSFLGLRKANEGLASNRGQAMTGLICAGVGIVLSIAFIILGIVLKDFDWQHYIDTHSTAN